MSDDKKRQEPNVFSDSKLFLYTEGPVKEGGKKGRLRIKLVENNPVIDVDYGYANDKGYQQSHETPLDPVVFNQMLIVLEKIAGAKGQASFEFDNWGHPFLWNNDLKKNVRSQEKMNISRIELGRYENGLVYIKYYAVKKPEMEFVFTENTEWHKMKPSGQESNPSRTSYIAALAWVETMKGVYNSYIAINWAEPEWRKKFRAEQAAKRNGNGGGNNNGYQKPAYNNQSNQSGGGKPPPEVADANPDNDFNPDDDVPF